MSRKKKKKTAPKKGKSPPRNKCQDKCSTSRNAAAKPKTNSRQTDPKMIVKNNNTKPATKSKPKPQTKPKGNSAGVEEERAPILERVSNMGGSHVAAVAASGVVCNALGVLSIGKGWTGPKTTAGLMMGAGAVATGSGWYWDMDHVMAMGVGATAAGAFSMANILAVDTYDAMEKRAAEKRKKLQTEEEAKDKQKRLVEARALIAAENKKHRNARRITIANTQEDDESSTQAA